MAFWTISTALLLAGTSGAARDCNWQSAWVSAQMVPGDENAAPAGALNDATLRQVIRLTAPATRMRVRISNQYGRAPLRLAAAGIARSADNATARIDPATARRLSFGGRAGAVVPAGAEWLSDPVDLPVAAFGDVAISLYFTGEPDVQTAHPGSRATSHVARGDRVGDADLAGATTRDNWFQIAAVEAERCAATPGAIVAFGDSITDGYGVKPNSNQRWTDLLARRLGGRRPVLNQGIGGNRLLLDGLGPNAMARFERDVLAQPGVSHVVVLEGVNDLGTLTRERPATPEAHRALVEQITAAYAQMVARARSRGIRAIGATILPFAASGYYHPGAATEADRQVVNAWIRAPGNFDAVIDFDAAMRDSRRPAYLNPAYDSGDGLHPSMAGYRAMADAVPLSLFGE